MRLPRFLKATLGLLNSAVLPFASRLEAANSQSTLRTLHEHGLVVVAFLTAPPTFALATFSKPLLDLWVGDALARYWLWQSLAFSTPLVTAIIGFASMSMFGRSNVIKFMALMILARIAIQYGMAFLFIGKIGERAFIFGATVAVIITAVWELKLLLKLQKVGKRARFSLLNVFLLCAALGALVFPITIYVTSIPKLLFSLVLFCLFSWAVVWFAVMPKDFRERLLSHLKNTSYWT
jgi:O-antigen/teichoic acid export membrane protein